MNILVTGANGQLGQEMRQVSTSSTDRYIFTDVAELDITDAITVKRMVRENNIKVIVNCAAYTDVDRAEDDVCMAELLNAIAVRYLAEALKANDGILIHVSTDYVFGSTQQNTPYKEDHPVNPTGVYGLTKLHGEQTIANVDCHHIIIRTAWLYSEFGKNFVKTMLQLTAQKPQVKVVFDQVGTPTYAFDLAATIFNIVENRQYEGKDGIYHFSNEGVCSWFDFAKMIVKYAGHTACDIRPCHSSEFSSKVHRPSYSVLDKTKIKEAFGIQIPYWTESLQTCIEQLKNKV
ncbi:dTDP-4-dehydrorhamnose reductase [Alistipes indistinctus]|nr:dTDP-4-dehydrorhamnose reductase [Alistipes indistinctus]